MLEHFENQENADKEILADTRERDSGKKIMIVEDEEIVIILIKGVLEDENITMDSARNGKDTLKKITSNEYKLQVCDIIMPKISGIALYKGIKALDHSLTKNFIFITGDPSSETINFLNEMGNEFIMKPFKIDKFKARVHWFLSHGAANDALIL